MKIDNLILKLIWKHAGPRIAKMLLKKNKERGVGPPDPEIYCCSARVIGGVWPWCSIDEID